MVKVVAKGPRKVAVFDVDGTIFRSSLLISLVDTLIEKDLFPASTREEFAEAKNKWLDRKGDYQKYIDSVVVSFMKHIRGVAYTDFNDSVKIVTSRYKDHIYRYTMDLVKKLKKKGYFLLAISQSPKGVLDPICKSWGFDKVYGRFYELGPSDRFTGKIENLELITNKANVLRRAVQKDGLTLEGSFGVGDTESDIPFLEMVENPICFNPNEKLYTEAKRQGWKVVVERKDVIYEL
ncbi:MAG: HAD-IB family hydrolase [Patescibacteria group bacterium]